jgi:energy-coupling factor transport system ATP-binding protein
MSVLRFEQVTYAYPDCTAHASREASPDCAAHASREASPDCAAPALREVSFELAEGEVCLLAALSGHGKSTLLRAACGLAPHFHGGSFAGQVTVCGRDTRSHGPSELGASVAVLFQDPETQLVMSSVRAEIALPLQSRGLGPEEVARGVEEVALALGVDHLLSRRSAELSGGEQQRVALAAALAPRPRLVLLDEPTSQLDPVAGDELIGLLRRLNQEWETTIVLAEHRLERCLSIADRVLTLEQGRIVHDGDPASFLQWARDAAPHLQTPGARLLDLLGVEPPPVGVRQARATLRAAGLLPSGAAVGGARAADADPPARDGEADPSSARAVEGPPYDLRGTAGPSSARPASRIAKALLRTSRGREDAALSLRDVWHELRDGPAILRGVKLTLMPGETVALMGRNGAGKSTLLRHAAGLMKPTRGSVHSSGRVALLLQNPGDYLLHDRVTLEASPAAIARAGLADLAERNPRDLSGGQRQRLALAIVTDAEQPPAVLAFDEPTRGMDRAAKAELAERLRRWAHEGSAVVVATHDPEFAAACAERALLMADGRVIADAPCAELLSGGWYFATETARILGGRGGALLPEQGANTLGGGAMPGATA